MATTETNDKPVKKRQRSLTVTRRELINRLENPEISLQEAAILLEGCRATVRVLCDEKKLAHHRTDGGQRRFFYRDIKEYIRDHGTIKKKRRVA